MTNTAEDAIKESVTNDLKINMPIERTIERAIHNANTIRYAASNEEDVYRFGQIIEWFRNLDHFPYRTDVLFMISFVNKVYLENQILKKANATLQKDAALNQMRGILGIDRVPLGGNR